MDADLPQGYVAVRAGGAHGIVRAGDAAALASVLATGSLYDFAARHPHRRALMGRAAAFAIPLGSTPVVVRHNRHGGLLAPLTGDRFLAPTRAPYELATSLRLQRAAVRTPEVVAIVRYPAGGPLERADVATREIAGAVDLAAALVHGAFERGALAAATGTLLRTLAVARAHHEDLNIKNVLVRREGDFVVAFALDVDRVVFDRTDPAGIHARNLARLERSARKWAGRIGPGVEDWIAAVRGSASG